MVVMMIARIESRVRLMRLDLELGEEEVGLRGRSLLGDDEAEGAVSGEREEGRGE